MKFEWDERKNKLNIQKHGCSFQQASKVFFDESRIESDYYRENGEWRFDVLGISKKVLFVVCTERDGDVIRLISARPATKKEEAIYYGDGYYDHGGNHGRYR